MVLHFGGDRAQIQNSWDQQIHRFDSTLRDATIFVAPYSKGWVEFNKQHHAQQLETQ